MKSINPATDQLLNNYQELTDEEIISKLDKAKGAFESWRKVPLLDRCKLLTRAGEVLRENIEEYAKTITEEMGKPISESRSEIEKCAWACDFYAENAEEFLKNEFIETDAQKSFVAHHPIGTVFAVMPWNFPFWQVIRFAAPTLTSGNTGVLKHASNVFGCALCIEDVFKKAGYPEFVFQSFLVSSSKTEIIISHEAIKAVTLTGSEAAGKSVAALAGKYLKKSLLELGGNNAFIVLEDADLDEVAELAVKARMLNAGQSCIAAKRFIIAESIYDEFVEKFIAITKKLRTGNPLKIETTIGPLARKELATDLQKQISVSVSQGAEILLGGGRNGAFHEPTVLGNVLPGMPAFDEETFGPLAAMIKAKNTEEAYQLAANSSFGLGVTVCTTNIELALSMAPEIPDGAYFINELVKSDPRLPFGGTKNSGYGRELGKDGMMEFVNRQTVYLK